MRFPWVEALQSHHRLPRCEFPHLAAGNGGLPQVPAVVVPCRCPHRRWQELSCRSCCRGSHPGRSRCTGGLGCQCLGILGFRLSPNLRTHLGNTAHLMWDSLNTTFGQPGVSAIFADYQAAISLKVTGGQNLQVKIQQLNTLFECLAVNSMSISDPMQGMILLNALPAKWDSAGMVYLQSTCQLTNVSFQSMREAVMAEFECTTRSSTIAVNKISSVKRKGKEEERQVTHFF